MKEEDVKDYLNYWEELLLDSAKKDVEEFRIYLSALIKEVERDKRHEIYRKIEKCANDIVKS